MVKNFEIQKLRVITSNVRQVVREDGKRVITKVDYQVFLPKEVADMAVAAGYPYENVNWSGTLNGTCTGISVLSDGDRWDEAKGRAISKARAEKNAYRQAATRVVKLYRRISTHLDAYALLVDDLSQRAGDVIAHNDAYIKGVVGEE